MLAVTHYRTSFLKLNSKRMVPCFALGVDMHVDSIIRIPPIHKLVIEFSETGERDKIGQAPPPPDMEDKRDTIVFGLPRYWAD